MKRGPELFARRCRALKLLLFDVDGVMTDGTVLLLPDGQEAKAFHVRDGLGIVLAHAAGIATGLLSGRKSEVVARRAAELGMSLVRQGVTDKGAVLQEILAGQGLEAPEVGYVGDDLNDLPVMGAVGLSAAPRDAAFEVRAEAFMVLEAGGGAGCVREFVEAVLRARGDWDRVTAAFGELGEVVSLTTTALVAVALAAAAGVVAGRAFAHARHRGLRDRPGFRTSPHYTQGLHYLASGQLSLAMSELAKVAREDPEAVDVLQVLSHLQRETGQVERAIGTHQALLARPDLTRAERSHALASLGVDFRKAGFVDRAGRAFEEALAFDPNNIYALVGQRKVHEDSRQWREAYEVQTRLSRLRKADDRLILGYLEVLLGDEAREASDREGAERRYRAALALDRRVFPAYLGLADLYLATEPERAASVLEEAQRAAPERAYLTLERLERASRALGAPERFTEACERILRQDPRDFRARLALARHLRARGHLQEALGLLLRALEMNGQALVLHVEALDVLRTKGALREEALAYARTVEASVFYLDPHLCTECHYRSDGMLWRCPHCHEWNTFVEERIAPMTVGP